MPSIRAAEVAKRRLSLASHRLGVKDPVPELAGLIDRSFELPLGDPRYGNNALTPGSLPLEHSFSEVQSRSLRLDLEPLGPDASPLARRQEASREMRKLVHHGFGKPALLWFDKASEPFRGAQIPGNARFGAWLGGAWDRYGLGESKVYYELGAGDLQTLPDNLQHAAQIAMSMMPGLTPIFTSISCGRQAGAQRIYFFHRGDLRLLDLEPLMNRLGVGGQLPSLLTAVGLILGGRFTLPEGSVILGLRDTQKGMELKLDVLLPGVPDLPQEMPQLIDLLLEQRPESKSAFHNWRQAMSPDETYGNPGKLSVVSVRVNPQQPGRLTLYFRPVGYDQAQSRGRPASPTNGLRS